MIRLLTAALLLVSLAGAQTRLNLSRQGRVEESTVAALPASNNWAGRLFIVTDGSTSSDCTTGGGANRVLCEYNGSAWASLGGGGGGGASALNDLSDVTITVAATGEVLRYNGSAWVDATLVEADISDLAHTADQVGTGAQYDIGCFDASGNVAACSTGNFYFNSDFFTKWSDNAVHGAIFENANAGTLTQTLLQVRNGVSVNDSLRFGVLGTGFTTVGSFRQDAGVISSDIALTGGLAIISRHTTGGIITFTTGGHTAERGRFEATGEFLVNTTDIDGTPPSAQFIVEGSGANIMALRPSGGASNVVTVDNAGLLEAATLTESGNAVLNTTEYHAGTDPTADLEEETHASEHAENAADELTVEGLGTACTSGQIFKSDGAGGVDCGTDDTGSSGWSNTSVYVQDEFSNSSVLDQQIGELGWYYSLDAGASIAQIANEANHPGIVRLTTGATADRNAAIYLGKVWSDTELIDVDDNFDVYFLVRPQVTFGTDSVELLVGLRNHASNSFSSNVDTVAVTIDTTETSFRCTTIASATATRTDMSVTATNNTWYKIRVRRVNGTTIGCTVNDGTETTVTTNIPTTNLGAMAFIETNNTTSLSLDVDAFAYSITGLSRF